MEWTEPSNDLKIKWNEQNPLGSPGGGEGQSAWNILKTRFTSFPKAFLISGRFYVDVRRLSSPLMLHTCLGQKEAQLGQAYLETFGKMVNRHTCQWSSLLVQTIWAMSTCARKRSGAPPHGLSCSSTRSCLHYWPKLRSDCGSDGSHEADDITTQKFDSFRSRLRIIQELFDFPLQLLNELSKTKAHFLSRAQAKRAPRK